MSQTRLTFISEALLVGLEVQASTVIGWSPGAPEIEAPSTKVVRTYSTPSNCIAQRRTTSPLTASADCFSHSFKRRLVLHQPFCTLPVRY
jgi:hypothetical protein